MNDFPLHLLTLNPKIGTGQDTSSLESLFFHATRTCSGISMTLDDIRDRFTPALDEIIDRCRITDDFVDREQFQVLIATIWGNAVVDPERSGIEESDLEDLHDFLNEQIDRVMGEGATISSCFEFIVSKEGDESLERQHVTANHKEFLHYFARLILQDVQA